MFFRENFTDQTPDTKKQTENKSNQFKQPYRLDLSKTPHKDGVPSHTNANLPNSPEPGNLCR